MSVAEIAASASVRRFGGAAEMVERYPQLSEAKLAQLRFRGEGPKYYKPTPKTVLYSFEEFDEWILSTARTGTAEAV